MKTSDATTVNYRRLEGNAGYILVKTESQVSKQFKQYSASGVRTTWKSFKLQ